MCFTPQVSGTLFFIGVLITAHTYIHQDQFRPYTYKLCAFYTLMELLQTIQYFYVNQCDSNMNIFLTNVAYILVIVQPIMWNTIFYLRNKGCAEKNIFKVAIALSGLWVIWSVLLRFAYNPQRDDKYAHCGAMTSTSTCTRRKDTKHLFWNWTTAYIPGLTPDYFMYLCLWILPALLTKSERKIGYIIALGAVLSVFIIHLYKGEYAEFASTWCLFSIPFILATYYL